MADSAGIDHSLRAAWLSLLLIVPCILFALAAGEGIMHLLGYEAGAGTPPFWAAVLASTPAFLICALPIIPTWHYGHRARGAGIRGALLPFGITAGILVVFLLLNTFPLGQWLY
ncbi:hypothetical protein PROP_03113 [Propionicimonas sp. T2.31MG-18]|uniref:hypothetical protein n=1 Tax=Propionicimonas sp. T2.31MG-18 TaxID=3157620 RepID=UPI0035EF4782